MNKKPINKILQEQYKLLEDKETRIRKQFASIRTAKTAKLRDIALSLYHDCMNGDKLDYSKLFRKISKQKAYELKYKTDMMRTKTDTVSFPFSVTRFDQLNRLEASKAEIIINELDQANELNSLFMLYLIDHFYTTMTDIAKAINVVVNDDRKNAEKKVDNKSYPIKISFEEQHYNTASKTAQMLQQCITRGDDAEKAVSLITEYATKRDKNADDRLIYTEDTRATCDAVFEVVEPYIEAFMTVGVHDGKQCEQCKGIEKEQAINPVPVKQYEPGITAPPFHPYCRCGIEVIWL